ncbi:hypothetical protein B0H12DRAFT_1082238 [Mycena haematopus]|nr:hypothetical protein B0H12DRAFT_1082238 [Mycena haematopus]
MSSSKPTTYTGYNRRAGKRKAKEMQRNTHVETVPEMRSDEVVDVRTHSGGVAYKKSKLVDYANLPLVLEPKRKPKKPQVDQTKVKQTQTAQLAAEFESHMPYLARKLLAVNEADPAIGQPCLCGRTETVDTVQKPLVCEVQCHNCTLYATSCKLCFAEAHRTNPFHWAEVWDHQAGFFRRHNLSALGRPLELGHARGDCKNRLAPVPFVVTADTGVHALSISFCGEVTEGEDGLGARMPQLLNARMMPCTFKNIQSAITFNALKAFQMHHLESKTAAMDYCGALRRLSDNAFTATVPARHVRKLFTMQPLVGCSHDKNTFGPGTRHRQAFGQSPPGNTVLYCPSCPEPGFNMDPKMGALPDELRHLRQQRDTLDGNFHCTKSTKNTDPNSYSLYKGSGFFPTDQALKEQLEKAIVKVEHPTCNYLKAVNNQDKKKFKNMEITGIVNDLGGFAVGERYANVDLAFATAIRQKLAQGHTEVAFDFRLPADDGIERTVTLDGIDRIMSYDAACQYSANIIERFEQNPLLSDLLPIVEKIRWAVPALHIQGHQENCMYKFATAYMSAAGHFHGETAEFYWPELNQIGTQVTQMSAGRRQDVIALNHNDWNFKKMAKSSAQGRFGVPGHQANFIALSATFAKRIIREGWLSMDRGPDTKDRKYTKIPTQLAIYESMLADESAIANGFASRNKVAAFLNEGILIQAQQYNGAWEAGGSKEQTLHESGADADDELQDRIQKSIAEWRKTQKSLTPAVEAHLNQLVACPVHKEMLGLPSDFSAEQRVAMNLSAFEEEEASLREGAAHDALKVVKLVVKTRRALCDRRKKNSSGVYKNTISQKQIQDTERRRDLYIAKYNLAAKKLNELRGTDSTDYPELTVEDTALKSRSLRRQLGRGIHGFPCSWSGCFQILGGCAGVRPSNTVMVRRPAGQRSTAALGSTSQAAAAKPRASGSKPPRKGGWLWTFQVGKMGTEEFEEWMAEGDKIQWFRAEAEMERWREEVETVLADWRTTIRSFEKYKKTWGQLAEMQDPNNTGHIAYAKQKADMFAKRELEGRTLLPAHKVLGPKYGMIVQDVDLVEFVTQNRRRDQTLLDGVLEAARKEEEERQEKGLEGDADSEIEDESDEEDWDTDDNDDDDQTDEDDNAGSAPGELAG